MPYLLTDAQIRILRQTGSVTGINFGPEFLNEDVECKDSTAELMAKHARHIVDVGGIEACRSQLLSISYFILSCITLSTFL